MVHVGTMETEEEPVLDTTAASARMSLLPERRRSSVATRVRIHTTEGESMEIEQPAGLSDSSSAPPPIAHAEKHPTGAESQPRRKSGIPTLPQIEEGSDSVSKAIDAHRKSVCRPAEVPPQQHAAPLEANRDVPLEAQRSKSSLLGEEEAAQAADANIAAPSIEATRNEAADSPPSPMLALPALAVSRTASAAQREEDLEHLPPEELRQTVRMQARLIQDMDVEIVSLTERVDELATALVKAQNELLRQGIQDTEIDGLVSRSRQSSFTTQTSTVSQPRATSRHNLVPSFSPQSRSHEVNGNGNAVDRPAAGGGVRPSVGTRKAEEAAFAMLNAVSVATEEPPKDDGMWGGFFSALGWSGDEPART